MKKYIIFDLDGTLINSTDKLFDTIKKFFKEHQPYYYDDLKYHVNLKRIANIKDLIIQIYGKFEDEEQKIHDELYLYLDETNKKSVFLDGTYEKIIELKNKYKLYLSTGSSTRIANEILDKSGLSEYFEIILGSDKIPKSEVHLDIFMANSRDKDFFEKSISIGDGILDEVFAKNRGIDFIKIGDEYKSISDIKEI